MIDNATVSLLPAPTVSVVVTGEKPQEIDGDDHGYATDPRAARFVFTRTGDVSKPLVIDVDVSGAAQEDTNYTWAGAANPRLRKIVFPAGKDTVAATVIPINDHVAGWTKDVKMRVVDATDGSYEVQGDARLAEIDIRDSNLGVQLGDDSNYQAITSSRTDGQTGLVQLTLDVPAVEKRGATITLTELPGTHADVWLKNDPGPGDVPILSDTKRSVTLLPSQVNCPFFVGAKKASAEEGDFGFTLTDGDDEAPGGPTGTANAVTTKPATWYRVGIVYGPDDVTDQVAGTVLVGQGINLILALEGPGADSAMTKWNVPSAGKPFTAYNTSGQSPTLQRYFSDLELHGSTRPTHFYFAGDGRSPFLSVSNDVYLSPNQKTTVSTQFRVLKPPSTFTARIGATNTATPSGGFMSMGLFPTPGMSDGIMFNALVSLPTEPQFAGQQGEWRYLQTADIYRDYQVKGKTVHDEFNHVLALDNSNPYMAGTNYVPPANLFYPTGQVTGPAVDSPRMPLDVPVPTLSDPKGTKPTKAWINENYYMFIMFRPPGLDSQWVPLKYIKWGFQGTALNTGAWGLVPGTFGQFAGAAVTTSDHPDWNLVLPPAHKFN
jgi:hypothetical protein